MRRMVLGPLRPDTDWAGTVHAGDLGGQWLAAGGALCGRRQAAGAALLKRMGCAKSTVEDRNRRLEEAC